MSYTAEQAELTQKAAHALLAQEELLAYATYIDPGYQCPLHIQYLAGRLEALERGEINRLIITMPPQHGKSELTSGKFPGWCMGRDHTRVCMTVGHTAEFIVTFSVQNRDTIDKNPRYREVFSDVALNPSRKGMYVWGINQERENFIASGITGGITGFGAWLIIIDDPIKTHEQASSPSYKLKVWNEYVAAARTRIRPDGRIIIIMTRWAEDDLVGRLLEAEKDGGDKWEVVHLPALSYGLPSDYGYGLISEAEYNERIKQLPKTAFPDRLGRVKDTPLWAERYTKDFLMRARATMKHQFECMYQGVPGAPEGNKFKRSWFRAITQDSITTLRLEPLARGRSWDLAWSNSAVANNTVGVRATLYKVPKGTTYDPTGVGAELGANINMPPVAIVLEDVKTIHEEWDEASTRIAEVARVDSPLYTVYMESVASQSVWVKSLRKDPRMWRHDVVGVPRSTDKEDNAKAAQRFASLGCVFVQWPSFTTEPEWLDRFLEVLCLFPNASEDDEVDALAQLVNKWAAMIDEILHDLGYADWFTGSGETAKAIRKRPPELTPDESNEEETPVDLLVWGWE